MTIIQLQSFIFLKYGVKYKCQNLHVFKKFLYIVKIDL